MLIRANCRHTLPLRDNSVQCIITSPPYYRLRNYGVAGQIGLEADWREWLDRMVQVFDECFRVLRDDGVLWLNVGDKYCQTGGRGVGRSLIRAGRSHQQENPDKGQPEPGFKYKDLMGLPWRLAMALQDRGWYLRRDIIWHKPTAMPESVKDRPTTAHEYIFLFSKSGRYFYNQKAMMEPVTGNAHHRGSGKGNKTQRMIRFPGNWAAGTGLNHRILDDSLRRKNNSSFGTAIRGLVSERARRSVWSVTSQPFKGAHFATFPPRLIEPMLLASTRPGDLVLDPFAGAGTVPLVAERHCRKWIGFELKPEYIEMAKRRIEEDKEVRLQRAVQGRFA